MEYALDALRAQGFRNTDTRLCSPRIKALTVEKNAKAPEGTGAGVTTGAVIGGALGWLAGIGALVIPGIGPLLAAGPIVAGPHRSRSQRRDQRRHRRWWARVVLSTKPNATEAASRAVAYCIGA